MSQITPDEFFRERPAKAKDLFHAGLALMGLGAFFKLMSLGAPRPRETLWLVLMCGGCGIASMVGAAVTWMRRRWGLRATRIGLSEVWGLDRERLLEWEQIGGVEESTNEVGLVFMVKTAGGEVKFDSNVEGWERLVARIRAELAERKAALPADSKEASAEAERPDLARWAPWLGALPRTLGYPRSSYRKMVWAWVGTTLGLLLMGLAVHSGGFSGGLFYSVMMLFAAFLGTTFGLRHAKKRSENARVVLSEEGLTVVDEEGTARRSVWNELLQVQEVKRPFHASPVPSAQARRLLAPQAIQVRTPWGFFEIDKGLEEYPRLLQLLEKIVAERDQPPAYPAERQIASAAALSRAQSPLSPRPTDSSLSQAEEPPKELPRLAQGVEEAAPESPLAEVLVKQREG